MQHSLDFSVGPISEIKLQFDVTSKVDKYMDMLIPGADLVIKEVKDGKVILHGFGYTAEKCTQRVKDILRAI